MKFARALLGFASACLILTCASITFPGEAQAAEGAYTLDQVSRGRSLYAEHCASCHGAALEGSGAPALVGKAFAESWSQPTRTVDDLFYIMRTSMPRPAVGSLSDADNLDILAFVLSRNGVPAGGTALMADSAVLAAVRMAATRAAGEAPAAQKKIYFVGEAGSKPRGKGPSAAELRDAASGTDWLYHTQNFRGTRYSGLDQINRENVGRLQVSCI